MPRPVKWAAIKAARNISPERRAELDAEVKAELERMKEREEAERLALAERSKSR